MSDFQAIASTDPIKEIIKSAFDTELSLSGGWGYTKASATIIHDSNNMPIEQLEHMIQMMRAYIEMNMTLSKEERYGSINPNEIDREQITESGQTYDKVTYEVTGMKEDQYALFINEYKENFGQPDFDLGDHFERRKKATIKRTVEHWFERHKIA